MHQVSLHVSCIVLSLDPAITNFNVAPTMVAVVESACPESEPHDSFTLVCRAMKPSVVIPELMVQWLYNGSIRTGDVSVTNNGTYVVNTLNVSNAQVSDAGLYQCVARIVILDSSTVSTNDSSTVISRGELLRYYSTKHPPLGLTIVLLSLSCVNSISLYAHTQQCQFPILPWLLSLLSTLPMPLS